MVVRSRDHSRLAPRDLIALTPFVLNAPRGYVELLSSATMAAPAAISFFVLRLLWEPLGYLALAAMLLAVIARFPSRTLKFWARILETRRWQEISSEIARLYAPRVETSQVRDVVSGGWVCNKTDHEERARQYRRENNLSHGEPLVQYRLVVATVREDGSGRRLAFGDGSVLTWHAQANVLCVPPSLPSPESLFDHPHADEASNALEAMIAYFASMSGSASVSDFVEACPTAYSEQSLLHATNAAVLWGLLRSVEPADFTRLYQAARDFGGLWTDRFVHLVLALTESGIVWQESTAEYLAEAREKRMSERAGRPSVVFSGTFHGDVSFVGRDSNTKNTHNKEGVTKEQLLQALKIILSRDEIPWTSVEFDGARPVIQAAVEQGDVDQPGLKVAVRKILQIGGDLVLGIAGNAVFEILRRFAT